MNIGMIGYPTYGGSGIIASELSNHLALKNHTIHFFSYCQPVRLNMYSNNIFFHKIITLKESILKYKLYESELISTVIDIYYKYSLDILHIHYAIPHAYVGCMIKDILLANKIKLLLITTLHGTDITLIQKRKIYIPLIEYAINHSDGLTTVSNSLKEDTLKYFNVKNNIITIPNFIDIKRFRYYDNNILKNMIAPNNEFIIIHVSNFRKVKNAKDVIIIFFKILQCKNICAKLVLIGEGPEMNNVKAICEKYNITEYVYFLGYQSIIEDFYNISDILLLPSYLESFSLVALEAMSCGVPVISSNAGGLSEININGKTGFVSPIGDIESMSKNAIYLLKNINILKLFKKNACHYARNFDKNNIVELYEKYYYSLIKK